MAKSAPICTLCKQPIVHCADIVHIDEDENPYHLLCAQQLNTDGQHMNISDNSPIATSDSTDSTHYHKSG